MFTLDQILDSNNHYDFEKYIEIDRQEFKNILQSMKEEDFLRIFINENK
jgi:hypothetical protein